ncbi:MAG: thermonuclease family protein [Bdellovibrionales bacterium]|nr:thermonuclease family protein [Bdellovibrionales bacterium]
MYKRLRIISSLISIFFFSHSLATASENCAHDQKTFRCVKYIKNYDGDTVTVEIPDIHPLLGKNISVRILGIDTPEKNGTKPCEKAKARDARRLVENLMKQAKRIDLKNIDRDKYFRILADVWVDNKSISEVLIKNKLAYPYDGGRKPTSISWCK